MNDDDEWPESLPREAPIWCHWDGSRFRREIEKASRSSQRDRLVREYDNVPFLFLFEQFLIINEIHLKRTHCDSGSALVKSHLSIEFPPRKCLFVIHNAQAKLDSKELQLIDIRDFHWKSIFRTLKSLRSLSALSVFTRIDRSASKRINASTRRRLVKDWW